MPRFQPLAAAAFLVPLLLPAGARADAALGAATPGELVERMRRAAATRDLVEASRCLTPEARTDMTAGMFVGAMLLVEFAKEAPAAEDRRMAARIGEDGSMDAAALQEAAERRAAVEVEAMELAERFEELLGRHGLDLPESADGAGLDRNEMTRRFLAIDQPAFLADLMAFVESASDETEPGAPPGGIELGALDALSVAGDRASATVGGRPVEMVRLDGRWFFASTDVMKAGSAAGGG